MTIIVTCNCYTNIHPCMIVKNINFYWDNNFVQNCEIKRGPRYYKNKLSEARQNTYCTWIIAKMERFLKCSPSKQSIFTKIGLTLYFTSCVTTERLTRVVACKILGWLQKISGLCIFLRVCVEEKLPREKIFFMVLCLWRNSMIMSPIVPFLPFVEGTNDRYLLYILQDVFKPFLTYLHWQHECTCCSVVRL